MDGIALKLFLKVARGLHKACSTGRKEPMTKGKIKESQIDEFFNVGDAGVMGSGRLMRESSVYLPG